MKYIEFTLKELLDKNIIFDDIPTETNNDSKIRIYEDNIVYAEIKIEEDNVWVAIGVANYDELTDGKEEIEDEDYMEE